MISKSYSQQSLHVTTYPSYTTTICQAFKRKNIIIYSFQCVKMYSHLYLVYLHLLPVLWVSWPSHKCCAITVISTLSMRTVLCLLLCKSQQWMDAQSLTLCHRFTEIGSRYHIKCRKISTETWTAG